MGTTDYKSPVKRYIESVDGHAHMSAVEVIAKMEQALRKIRLAALEIADKNLMEEAIVEICDEVLDETT